VRSHVRVGGFVLAAAVIAGAVGYLYVSGASVPKDRPDPLALVFDGDHLRLKVGTCFSEEVASVAFVGSEDNFEDASDPILWKTSVTSGNEREFSTATTGDPSFDPAVMDDLVSIEAIVTPRTMGSDGAELSMLVNADELRQGRAIVEGESKPRREFESYGVGSCRMRR